MRSHLKQTQPQREIAAIETLHYIRTLFEGTYTLRILENFVELFLTIGPYLLLSILLNAAVTQYARRFTLRVGQRGEVISILAAAGIGLLSPLPTYAAIPVARSVVSAGVPFCAIMAFVVSSPLINPGIFLLTATQIGWEMAVARTAAAFLIGVTAGFVTRRIPFALPTNSDCKTQVDRRSRPIGTEIYRSALYAAKFFSIAMLLSAAVKALVPAESVKILLGGSGATGTLIAIGMGVPFYTCGGAAIPFMQTLMGLGMSKGATLAFFTAGPATKVETLYAFKSQLGWQMLAFYLALTICFSFIAGWIYSFF